MAIVPWSSVMSVGNGFLDNQHKILLGIINEVYAGVIFGRSVDIFKQEYPVLLEYANLHFEAEEELMAAAHYEGLAVHRQQHIELKQKLLEFGENILNLRETELDYKQICTFLREWLVRHVMTEDRGYSEAISMLGKDVIESVAKKYSLEGQVADSCQPGGDV